jgi:ferredoxin-NADP reductase
MAERRVGTVIYWHTISPVLGVFKLMPEDGTKFPEYIAGQYIALRREDCKLTKKEMGPDGHPRYVPDLDEHGVQKIGNVTHSYSISSAPFETKEHSYLEFYIILERDEEGHPGRLTESLFHISPPKDSKVVYVDRITGDFTLAKRAESFQNVVLVGTGTGLAPFASMIKQLHYEYTHGRKDDMRYTLFHTNRVYEELGYHEHLLFIEAERNFDFVYIPSISRPTERDSVDSSLGKGRANNILRSVFGMPLKEEHDLNEAYARGEDITRYQKALEKTTKPVLPSHISSVELLKRMDPPNTVLLTCGNPDSMADIKHVADANQIRFEKEDW